jgi:hypothetical protein
MRDEYDFSNAEQGKFYRPIKDLEIQVYLGNKGIWGIQMQEFKKKRKLQMKYGIIPSF